MEDGAGELRLIMGAFADAVAKACDEFTTRARAMPAAVVDEASDRILDRSIVGKPALWKRPPPKDYVPGTFKSNWRLGIDMIDVTTIDEQNSFVLHGRDRMPADPFGHRIFISNSLPYAWPLETGHSTQGQGMVGLTALEFDTILAIASDRVKALPGGGR